MRVPLPVLVTVLSLTLSSAAFGEKAASSKRTRSSAPSLSPEVAQVFGITPNELSAASKLYSTKCMRCHKSYEPASYSQQDWDGWMRKMSRKAHLSSEQDSLLAKYLTGYRAAAGAAATNQLVVKSNAPALP
jgi:cytochrome c5